MAKATTSTEKVKPAAAKGVTKIPKKTGKDTAAPAKAKVKEETPLPSSTWEALMPEDIFFTRKALRYFGVPRVRFALHPSTPDIAVQLGLEVPVILLGKKFIESSPRERHKKITHELIHIKGYHHSREMRELGYFSEPERDTLSLVVYRAIERGHKRFDPQALGLPPPGRRE